MSRLLEFRLSTEGQEVAAKAFLGKLLEGATGVTVEMDEDLVQLTLWKGGANNETVCHPLHRSNAG